MQGDDLSSVVTRNGTLAGNGLKGLTADEVQERRERYGENALPQTRGPSVWSILLAQFKSPLVYIILVAAFISLLAGERGDFAIIMAVVLVDAALGFVQEYQAQRTYVALRGLLRPTATVIRDGNRQELETRELVPDDLVILSAGEKVPADGELIESVKMSVDEAILTGESEPVSKAAGGDGNGVYMGTTLLTGRGIMRVTKTGSRTQLGEIAVSLKEHEEGPTPLQVRLGAFSQSLTKLVLVVTLAIFIVGLATGRPMLEMLRVSIILAVAAVPEGLLIAVTVILVLGMRKILKRNGLVKRLLAVETLGSVTVICTDKTGTLTEGRMRVTREAFDDADRAVQAMVLCNDLQGPVDVALWEHARSLLGTDPQALADGSRRLDEEPFTSENKFMITSVDMNGERVDLLKGAPEIVLDMCTSPESDKVRVLDLVDQWASDGLRPLGMAYRSSRDLEDRSGYTWTGLVGMDDPVRDGVQEAVRVAQHAGVAVKMITGDYRRTAERVAISAGLTVNQGQVLEGHEIAEMSDEQLQSRVGDVAVFARIRPQDKLRIVRALQACGEITAMIGDGVNDAPALQRADIGVVVGTATDLAKETADLILLDSNFRTVVAAIEEGRVVFENIRKVVAYTLSNSFAEVLTIFGAMVMGWPAPLLVAQILWIHLICDGPSDIVLGFEPKEPNIMDEKPRPLSEPILDRLGISLIGIISVVSAVVALVLFNHYYGVHGNIVEARTYAFATFAVNSMIYIFAYRSLRLPMFRMVSLRNNRPLVAAVAGGLALAVGAVSVPALRNLLDIVPLDLNQWSVIAAVALGLMGVVELAKWGTRRRSAANGAPVNSGLSTL